MRTLCAFANDFENLGGGYVIISKILKAIQENGSPAPEFDTDSDRSYFLIRLPVHKDVMVVETLEKTCHQLAR